ncbi:TetR/AcrR family transcriptional regulator C-terminal ligand-binding domain-containing protein [Streptomyces sp. NPDC059851]|uniref:TetR/AcrR family transcriptional regulator C-terminal ligand-binding domain-containing protein n=1 Tax=Streptomyces sp. NPDC059851 TaxID=3346971 RepID=UPI003668CCE2
MRVHSARGDLTAWAEAGVAAIRKPEGRLLVRAVALSMPGSAQEQGSRTALRTPHPRRRAHPRAGRCPRGDPPPLDQTIDQLVAPLYLPAIFGIDPPASGYPELLVDRLLGGMGPSPAADTS